ncbi:MAG: hypothetical protein ACLSA6_07300 [Holdemania massiliensis]
MSDRLLFEPFVEKLPFPGDQLFAGLFWICRFVSAGHRHDGAVSDGAGFALLNEAGRLRSQLAAADSSTGPGSWTGMGYSQPVMKRR